MSITYHINAKLGVTISLYDGQVTQAELLAHFRKQMNDPAWPTPGKLQLVDLRSARGDSITTGMLQEVAELRGCTRQKNAGLKMAIIAGDEFTNSSFFAQLLEKYYIAVIVFNSLDTACTWLGIDPREVDKELADLRRDLVTVTQG